MSRVFLLQEFAYYGSSEQEKNQRNDELYKDEEGDGTAEDETDQTVEAKNQQK